MSEIAAVGDWESIQVFRSMGAETIPARTKEEVSAALERCVKEETRIVFLTEAAYEAARETVDLINEKFLPAICLIPDASGSRGLGVAALRQASHRAIGTEIQ